MKKYCCMFLLFLVLSAESSSVLWREGFQLTGGVQEYGETAFFWLGLDLLGEPYNVSVYNLFGFLIEKGNVDSERKLSGSGADVGRAFVMVHAQLGEEISSEITHDGSRLFLKNSETSPEDTYKTFSYSSQVPWTLYLGFETTQWGNWGDDEPDRKLFGWVELFVDDYTLSLGDTCLDLSGRPVVVGVRSAEPIPEPATGALALVGAALLFRRPRRGRTTRHSAASRQPETCPPGNRRGGVALVGEPG